MYTTTCRKVGTRVCKRDEDRHRDSLKLQSLREFDSRPDSLNKGLTEHLILAFVFVLFTFFVYIK